MATISTKVSDRLTQGIKRYQPILSAAKSRDVNEADTVTIVKDMLQDVFGYDKYVEITGEHLIRGTFVDLAIKLDGQLSLLIEVKAVGLALKDAFVKQAVDYAANQGVEWVILTNGVTWRIYRLIFAQPIAAEMVIEIDFCGLNPRSSQHLEQIFLLTREGQIKSVLGEYHAHRQALSRYVLGAVMLSEPVIDCIRRELKRMSPDARVDAAEVRASLINEVIKREVVEGEKADEAKRKLSRVASRALRAKATSKKEGNLGAIDPMTNSALAEENFVAPI